MDKKQKIRFVSISIILLTIMLLIGYTFAKYYSSYQGEGRFEIAKWNFKVNGWSSEEVNQIPLINTANGVNLEDGKIAPGASGKFEIELDAKGSEVDVEYKIEATETGNKPANLLFSVKKDGVATDRQYASLQELAQTELNGTITKGAENQLVNLEIIWDWPYETGEDRAEILMNDEEDTQAGTGTIEGQEDVFDYTFSLKVIGTQAKATT